jgi:hypothetical protein
MAFATPKRVQFSKEVSKWSNTPTPSGPASNTPRPPTSQSKRSSSLASNSGHTTGTANKDNAITVAIRVRPLAEKEKQNGFHNVIRVDEPTNDVILSDKSTGKQHRFHANHVITDQKSTLGTGSDNVADAQQQFV